MKTLILQAAVAVVLLLNPVLAQAETENSADNMQTSESAPMPTWLHQGERLTYEVSWGWLNAGEAELLYRPENEDKAYTIVARAWTENPLFSLKERLRVSGTHTQNGERFMPELYEQDQRENDFRANKQVQFKRTENMAAYDSLRDTIPPEAFEVMPNARDMLSALYFLRQELQDLDTATQTGSACGKLAQAL